MEKDKVKSGKEVLDDFFETITNIPKVDNDIAKSLSELYQQGKFSDINIKNALQALRNNNGN